MRSFLFGYAAITLLTIPACNFRSSNSEAEVPRASPTPIPDSDPVASSTELVEELEPIIAEPVPQPEFTLDPAPTPPSETWSASDEATASESSSADEVLKSVARVLKGAVEGEDSESDGQPTGSIFGSIGRALSKGFQEAATSEGSENE